MIHDCHSNHTYFFLWRIFADLTILAFFFRRKKRTKKGTKKIFYILYRRHYVREWSRRITEKDEREKDDQVDRHLTIKNFFLALKIKNYYKTGAKTVDFD